MSHRITSFPQFSDIPLEVQDRIWELAIPVYKHTAYQVDLDLDRAPTRIRGTTQYVDQVFTVFRLVPNRLDAFTARQTLRATCRRAAAAAERVTAAEMQPTDGFLHGSPTMSVRPPQTTSPSGTHASDVKRTINAKVYKDLMILTPLGQQQMLQLFFQHTIGTVNTGLKPEVRRPNSQLNYLAVHWPPTSTMPDPAVREPFWLRVGAMMLGLFPHLKAMYAIVDPGELAKMVGPWDFQELLSQTGQAMGLVETLAGRPGGFVSCEDIHLHAYEEDLDGLTEELRFRDGEREFFEVPYEQVKACGKLLRAMVMLEGARSRAARMMKGQLTNHDRTIRISPLRCRIMTWRDC